MDSLPSSLSVEDGAHLSLILPACQFLPPFVSIIQTHSLFSPFLWNLIFLFPLLLSSVFSQALHLMDFTCSTPTHIHTLTQTHTHTHIRLLCSERSKGGKPVSTSAKQRSESTAPWGHPLITLTHSLFFYLLVTFPSCYSPHHLSCSLLSPLPASPPHNQAPLLIVSSSSPLFLPFLLPPSSFPSSSLILKAVQYLWCGMLRQWTANKNANGWMAKMAEPAAGFYHISPV